MTQKKTIGGMPAPDGRTPLICRATQWGDLLFLSGRVAVDPATMKPVSSDFEEQARCVIEDVLDVLDEAGSGAEHVLRVVCYVSDAAHTDAWNRIWSEYFEAPRPARTTVVAGFVIPGLLIELEVTAGVPSPARPS